MSVTHIVHFSYVQTASAEEVTRFNQLFLEFGENPLDSRILSIIGGSNNSIEQLDHGFQVSFIATFASKADRDYYVSDQCVSHNQLKATLAGKLENVMVMDFEDEIF